MSGAEVAVTVELVPIQDLYAWLDQNPQWADDVMAWLQRFERDPWDPELHPLQIPNARGYERAFEYRVPDDEGLSIVVAIGMKPDSQGVLWAFILFPRAT